MAYPRAPQITWGEFLERLQPLGVAVNSDPACESLAWDARQETTFVLEKGNIHRAVPFCSKDDFMTWSEIRSICDHFEIECAEFGLGFSDSN